MLGRVGKPRGELAGRGFRATFPVRCVTPQCWCLLCFPWVPAQALSALSGALPAPCWWLRSGCLGLSQVKEAGCLQFLPVKCFGALLQLPHLGRGAGTLLSPLGARCQLWPWTVQCQDAPPGPTADVPRAAGLVLQGRKTQRT